MRLTFASYSKEELKRANGLAANLAVIPGTEVTAVRLVAGFATAPGTRSAIGRLFVTYTLLDMLAPKAGVLLE